MSASNDITMALAELAKGGVAFTSEVGPDGKTIYIIDTIPLSEDEVLLLQEKGAVTPEGIRHYLVDRAA